MRIEKQLSAEDEVRLDELETLQNKISDQLSELSNVEILPAGYKSDVFSIEVLSQCKIKEVRVAETLDGLRVA